MKKMSRESLIRLLDAMHDHCTFTNWDDEAEQDYKQIRKLIEEKPKVTRGFVQKWLEEFLYGAPESYPMIIKAMLKEAGIEVE